MRGEIEQTPPPVSAKKINGVPAYKLARQNIAVELRRCAVAIYELTLRGVEGDRARLRVRCSPGTYIRSIAHELGLALGCGAHIDELVAHRVRPVPYRTGSLRSNTCRNSRTKAGSKRRCIRLPPICCRISRRVMWTTRL